MSWILMILTVALTTASANETPKPPPVGELLDKIDDLYRSESSQSEVTMKVTTPDYERTMNMTIWSQGEKKTLVRINKPKKDADIGTLRIDQQMWNFFPKINKTIKISPSMMMGSWMGSDFTNDDLVRETSLRNDYQASIAAGPDNTWQINLVAKPDVPTVWAKINLVVDRTSLLPKRQEYIDEAGKVQRIMTFSDVADLGGRKLPRRMTLVPQGKKGHQTEMSYESIKFGAKLDDDKFSLRALRNP